MKTRGVCHIACECVCAYVCGRPEAPLVSGSPEHAGTAGQCVSDLSIWSLPGALTASLCSALVCVYVSVFLEGKTLQAVTVPETLTNKLICFPLLSLSLLSLSALSLATHSNLTPLTTLFSSRAAFKHNIQFVQSAQGTEDCSSYFHPPSCTVFSFPSAGTATHTQTHTQCSSPLPPLSDADYRLCGVLSVRGQDCSSSRCVRRLCVCVHQWFIVYLYVC